TVGFGGVEGIEYLVDCFWRNSTACVGKLHDNMLAFRPRTDDQLATIFHRGLRVAGKIHEHLIQLIFTPVYTGEGRQIRLNFDPGVLEELAVECDDPFKQRTHVEKLHVWSGVAGEFE